MILGMQRRRLAQRDAAPALDFGDREARVGSPDIDGDDRRAHDSPLRAICRERAIVTPPAAMQQGISMRWGDEALSDPPFRVTLGVIDTSYPTTPWRPNYTGKKT